MAKKLLKLTTLLSVLLLLLMLTGCPPKVVYYQLDVTTEGNGHVVKNPEPEEKGYLEGTAVELTAVADEGWEFEKWVIGEEEKTANPYPITMDSNKSVKAVFKAEEPPVDQFTLTVAKAGDGGGTVNPPVGDHQYDEGQVVTLTAEADANSDFVKWVVDDVVFFDATVVATMTKDIVATAHFDLKPGVGPQIILEWKAGDLMVLGAPCAAPEDGLGFQYLVGDSDSSLTEASWSIVKGEEVVYGPIAIPSSRFYNSWTGSITAAMLGADPVGGIYSLTMTATKTGGISKTEKIDFYVHTDEAAIDGVDFAGEIVLFEGTAILTGDEATLEATITLDSKARVRIYAYGGEWNCESKDNALLFDGIVTRDASSTEKETFDLDLTTLKADVDYDTLRIIVYNEICGTMPCNYCPDDEKDIELVFDEDIALDCVPCTCEPCGPCWKGFFDPGVRISNLLFSDEDFYKVTATINGETVPATAFMDPEVDGDDIIVRIAVSGSDFPELDGDALIEWTVTTFTGQEVVKVCEEDFDFVAPEVDIELVCDCDATTTVVPIQFTDDAGLKEAKVWFDESVSGLIKKVSFDATPTGESTTTFTSGLTSKWWNFPATGMIYDVIATIELDPDKIVSPTLGGSYTVKAYAEDTSCNISDEASETCAIDFVAPTITYFGLDCVGTDCDICNATQTTLVWHIRDVNFDYAEISVNYGNLCSDGQCGNTFITESKDGTVLWEFPSADCREITATIKAVDDCENESSKTIKFDVDNVPPELDLEWCAEPETCDATFARYSWVMSDPCTPTVYFGTIPSLGTLHYVTMKDDGAEAFTAYTTDGTTTKSGIIEWRFGSEFDCTHLTLIATATDERCENDTPETLTTDIKIDKLPPKAYLFVEDQEAKTISDAATKTSDEIPSCDATCVWVNWVVFEDCLESIEIWSNYPSVCETGGTGEYFEDEYLLLSWPGMPVNKSDDYSREAYWGSIKVCLPSNLDCEDFVATITAVQTCKPDLDDPKTYTSVASDSVQIDRKPPVIELGWQEEITACATEATLTILVTDGSFSSGTSTDATVSWVAKYKDGTKLGELVPTTLGLVVGETNTATGVTHLNFTGINCGTVTITVEVPDQCCSGSGGVGKETLVIEIDNVAPTVEDFYFVSESGTSTKLTGILTGDGTITVSDSGATITACATDFVWLYWDATDATTTTTPDSTGCYAGVEILMEKGDGTVVPYTSAAATGTVKWEFGEVSGKTLAATITALQSNGCLESDPATLSAYVRNTGPKVITYRFDASGEASTTVQVAFNEEVQINDGSTAANLYHRNNPNDAWIALATYDATGMTVKYHEPSEQGILIIDVLNYKEKYVESEPRIDAGKYYKLELEGVFVEDLCGKYPTSPEILVLEDIGKADAPEF